MNTITGNLLDLTEGIILHQVNCRGVTGGLAGALRRKWPVGFSGYTVACHTYKPAFLLGTTILCKTLKPALYIAHIFGQRDPGANTELSVVNDALTDLASKISIAELGSLPLYAPHLMGCGLGGGRWADYEPLLAKHFPRLTIIQLAKTNPT